MEVWRYELTGQAERDLRQLDRGVRQRVLQALDRFVAKPGAGPVLDPERGDVRRVQGPRQEYRLRVGD
jgi:mRNA-degrading endonuclease RelE of RelBE toxin-antitoxin system